MPIEEYGNLTPEALDLLSWPSPVPGYKGTPHDEVMMAAYACGVANPDQEAQTLAALVKSREMRNYLKSMETELDEMSRTPYHLHENSKFSPVLTHCVNGAMQAAMRHYSRARSSGFDREWDDVRSARDFEAKSVRAAIAGIGRSLRQMTGSRATSALEAKDAGPRVRGNVREDGALVVEVTNGHQPSIRGADYRVEFVDPNGGSLPIKKWVLGDLKPIVLDGFSEIAGIGSGPVPSRFLRVADRYRAEKPSAWGAALRAQVGKSKDSVMFEVLGEPEFNKGGFKVGVKATSSESAGPEGATLELAVPVGNLMQSLGRWPLCESAGEAKLLTCPARGVIDGKIECGSVLHLRIVTPE